MSLKQFFNVLFTVAINCAALFAADCGQISERAAQFDDSIFVPKINIVNNETARVPTPAD